MVLNNYFRNVILDVELDSKSEVLDYIANTVGRELEDEMLKETILDELNKREEMMSTAIGKGIAIPHCKIPNLADFVTGVVRTSKNVEFNAFDSKPCRLFFFIIAPENRSTDHVKILSALSTMLRNDDVLQQLTDLQNPARMISILHGEEHGQRFGRLTRGMVQFQTVIQEPSLLNEVIELFNTVSIGQLVVASVQTGEEFLYSAPLYSAFWHGKGNQYCKLVVANLDHVDLELTCEKLQDLMSKADDGSIEYQVLPLLMTSAGIR